MKWHLLRCIILVGGTCFAVSTASLAQQVPGPAQPISVDVGKIDYERKCATCHGLTGKGDGPTASYLTRKTSDLTVLAKNNSGILPVAAMYEIITGEKQVPGHGTREMPVWGEFFVELPYVYPETYMRGRILALIEYINRLQVK